MLRQRRHPGFTLIEIVVSLALSAIVLVGLYNAMHGALRAREKCATLFTPTRTLQTAMDMIRQDLQSALPPTASTSATGATGATGATAAMGGTGATATTNTLVQPFLGQPAATSASADAVEFYCVGGQAQPLDVSPPAGIWRMDLTVTTLEDGTPNVLVRQIWRNLLSQVDEPPEAEVICRGVKSFVLRYFDGIDWFDSWDSTEVGDILPVAVEVTLEIQWPADSTNEADVYRMTRIFPLPCSHPADTDTGTATDTGGA